jgi:hypothetical protein
MQYIEEISRDPILTAKFDAKMIRIKAILVALVLVCGGWVAWAVYAQPSEISSPIKQPVSAIAPAVANQGVHLPP